MKDVKNLLVHMHQNHASESRKENSSFLTNLLKGLALISIGPVLMANFLPLIADHWPQVASMLKDNNLDEASVLVITSLLVGVIAVVVPIGNIFPIGRERKYIGRAISFYIFLGIVLILFFMDDPNNFFDQDDVALFLYIKSFINLENIANTILVASYCLNVYIANQALEYMKKKGYRVAELIPLASIMGDGLATANRVFGTSGQSALIHDANTVALMINIILSLTFVMTNVGEAWPGLD